MHLRYVLLLALLVLGTLAATATAAPQPRIVNGTDVVSPDPKYPSQGFLLVDSVPGNAFFESACGGSLVSQTRFLTAAHCATDGGAGLPASRFQVWLGHNNVSAGGVPLADRYDVSEVQVHEDYDDASARNDVAMLTFDRPESGLAAPIGLVGSDDAALWADGVEATIIGWGAHFFGDPDSHDVLQEEHEPIRTDAVCAGAYGSGFHAPSMFCVGAADPDNLSSDTCQGDSGGPLLVPGGAPYLLAGVVSTGFECNREGFPGIYARIGAPGLNAWVRGRLAGIVLSQSPPSPTADQLVVFTATTEQGSGFIWDLDNDGAFDDASGSSASRTFPPGSHRVAVRVTDPEGEPAERALTVTIPAPPSNTAPTATPTPPTPSVAPVPPVVLTPRLATLIIGRSASVDRLGRFGVRINFNALAPAGKNAVLTVRKGSVKIGGAKVKVKRGESVRARVLLTKSGLRRLRKAKKLKVTLRLVLGTTVQTKTVLLRVNR